MPSNYFGTDCPVTFRIIPEIHPFWDSLALAVNVQEVAAPLL